MLTWQTVRFYISEQYCHASSIYSTAPALSDYVTGKIIYFANSDWFWLFGHFDICYHHYYFYLIVQVVASHYWHISLPPLLLYLSFGPRMLETVMGLAPAYQYWHLIASLQHSSDFTTYRTVCQRHGLLYYGTHLPIQNVIRGCNLIYIDLACPMGIILSFTIFGHLARLMGLQIFYFLIQYIINIYRIP